MGYSSTIFSRQRQVSQYDRPTACMNLNKNDINAGVQVMKSLTKTSAGTCVNFLDGANGCVKNAPNNIQGAEDCRPCVKIYNNVAPNSFVNNQGPSNPFAPTNPNFAKLLVR